MTTYQLLQGDCIEQMRQLTDQSVHCCVTSPPYFGLRDYGHDGQIGLEETPDDYVAKLVQVFREVRRVLRDDGTLWLNLGDSYVGTGAKGEHQDPKHPEARNAQSGTPKNNKVAGLKPKDLIGIPWRVAFALQADGWFLRQDLIWHKPNPMPESVKDRCTKAHEYIFLMSKSERYYFDQNAIKEKSVVGHCGSRFDLGETRDAQLRAFSNGCRDDDGYRNKRSVWTVATNPFKGAHFATYPPDLIRPCILAGCPKGGTVLDPFSGAATTGVVATEEGRNYIGIELNPKYVAMSKKRLKSATAQLSMF